jgi:hypothetical protein
LEMVHIFINVGLETIFAEGTSASTHLLVMFVLMCLYIPAYTYILLKILGVGCVNPIRTIKVILRANNNAPFSHEMFKRATMMPADISVSEASSSDEDAEELTTSAITYKLANTSGSRSSPNDSNANDDGSPTFAQEAYGAMSRVRSSVRNDK